MNANEREALWHAKRLVPAIAAALKHAEAGEWREYWESLLRIQGIVDRAKIATYKAQWQKELGEHAAQL